MSWIDISLRVALSLLIGGVIGWERERSHRPAGLRTHMLVSLGAAIVMITGQQSFEVYRGVTNPDPSRMGAQVVSGIGFLGAGTIMKEGPNIKGLTTAASLWSVACLGLAAGAGYYQIAIIGCIASVFVLTTIEGIEKRISMGKRTRLIVSLLCVDASKTLVQINNLLMIHNATLQEINMKETITEDGKEKYHLSFKVYTKKTTNETNFAYLSSQICAIKGVSNYEMEEF